MGPEVKKEHKYLPVLITVFVMIFVTASVAAGVWCYMDQQAKKAAEDNKAQVEELQDQINTANESEPASGALPMSVTTYKSPKGGFSIALPKGVFISEGLYGCEGACGQSVGVINYKAGSAYEDQYIDIAFYVNPSTPNLDEIVRNLEEFKSATSVKDIKIASVSGKYFSTPGMAGDSQHYYFVKGNYVYSIRAESMGPGTQEAILKSIVTNFKLN